MVKFEIEEIDNGYLVKGEFYWPQIENTFKIFAATLPDAYATIATKCDNLMDEEVEKVDPRQDESLF